MLIVDFKKLSPERINLSLEQLGIRELDNLPFLTILETLKLNSNKTACEFFPSFNKTPKINLLPIIKKLKSSGKIVELVGPNFCGKETPICFSTFLSLKPKSYLKNYIKIAQVFCREDSGLYFSVWLEDRLSVFKNNWDIETLSKALDIYFNFFESVIPSTKFLKSSEIAPDGIPKNFADEKFSALKGKDFLSTLPFHLRHPKLIQVFDVIHFAWECYVIYKYPAVYLAGINTKCHFQLFRKILGKHITVIFLPLGSENFLR